MAFRGNPTSKGLIFRQMNGFRRAGAAIPPVTFSALAILALAALLAAGWAAPALADIYMYRDSKGVMHFTNTPTSPQYRVFIRSAPAYRFRSTTRYDDLIDDAARRHGVDFSLLKAVIQAESGFDHRAVSRKGAQGLMQIMPENFEFLNLQDPFDPAQNIMAGAQYLRLLINRYNGQLVLSLAAYNAGPTAVDRYRQIPPIPETQDYVEKVLRFYRHYQSQN